MNHRWLIAVLAVLLPLRATSSMACLNDTSVRAAEDEFRSRYDSTSANGASAPANHPTESAINPWGIAGLAIGSGLIAGSLVGMRRRKREGV